ncbi:MAG: SH3 domain-containing protein [Anaerolineales bacterium]|jgi:Tol biopolymer transport system component/uncharacterized protein YgiM (DUF1202 family)
MKRLFLIAAIFTSLLLLSACTNELTMPVSTANEDGSESIAISTEQPGNQNDDISGNLDQSREEVPPTDISGFRVIQTDVKAVVTISDETTFYSGPGETYESVATVFGGLTWPVTGVSEDELWWQLTCSDKRGVVISECWVSADPSVTAPAEVSDATITVLATSVEHVKALAPAGLNLRAGPGLDHEVITLLPLGEVIGVTGVSEDGEWWRVLCPDNTLGECWLSADPALSEPITISQSSLAGLVYGDVNEPQRWIVNTDGDTPLLVDAESVQLARGPISPDGQYLLRGGLRGDPNLYLVDIQTGESNQLTNTPDRFNFNPQWWPENPGTIIFLSRSFDNSTEPGGPGPANLATVKMDGSGYRILDEEHQSHTAMPSLSTDGQTIAYDHGGPTASEDGILTPWIYQLQGGRETFNFAAYGLQQIPDLSFGSPAWSPDGSYLAWVVGGDLSGSGQWEAGIANFDLDNQTVQILNPYAPASCQFAWCFSAPVWSPDGMWLAWNGFPRDIPPGFWVMRPDGNDATYITDGGSPTWSPDGSLVAFNKLTGITVMEVGSWRPQSSGLPTGNMVIEWLNPEDVTMLKD